MTLSEFGSITPSNLKILGELTAIIAALIALAGVIYTTWANARQNKKNKQANLELERTKANLALELEQEKTQYSLELISQQNKFELTKEHRSQLIQKAIDSLIEIHNISDKILTDITIKLQSNTDDLNISSRNVTSGYLTIINDKSKKLLSYYQALNNNLEKKCQDNLQKTQELIKKVSIWRNALANSSFYISEEYLQLEIKSLDSIESNLYNFKRNTENHLDSIRNLNNTAQLAPEESMDYFDLLQIHLSDNDKSLKMMIDSFNDLKNPELTSKSILKRRKDYIQSIIGTIP